MDFRRPGRGYYYPDQPDYRAGYPGYPGGDAYGQAGGYMQNTNYTPYNGGYTQGMNQHPGNGYVQGMNQYPGNGYAQGMNQYPQTGVNPYRQQENPGSQNYSQSYTSNGTGTDYGMTGYNGQGQK